MFVISTLREKLALTKILFQLRQHLTPNFKLFGFIYHCNFAECLFAHLLISQKLHDAVFYKRP